jgi:ubiquinone/menaquinone biosynthesis C-methylase UbiE
MDTKIYNSKFERLRSPERLAKMEVPRVVELSLAGLDVKHVLDVGTGSGVFAEEFLKFVPEVSGVDLNPEALELAKKMVPQANYKQGKMEALPFEDDAFNLVFMGFVLHETPEREKALAEAKRCAKKRVVVFEWPSFEKDSSVDTGRRVSEEEMQKYSDELGFDSYSQIDLQDMMLYILDL